VPRIYISYRRNDVAVSAGRIYDFLSNRFGSDNTFLDLAAIQPGADFTSLIKDAVASADAVLVLIGPSWLSASLRTPDDFVRLEVAAALAAGKRVVPVLLEGARMPSLDELPPDLDGLVRRNALVVGANSWGADMERLSTALEDLRTPSPSEPSAEMSPAAPRRSRWWQLFSRQARPSGEPRPQVSSAPTPGPALVPDSPHDRSKAVGLVMARVDFDAAAADLPAVALAIAGVEGGARDELMRRVEELKQESMSSRAKALSLGFAVVEVVGLETLGAAVDSLGDSIRSPVPESDIPQIELFYSYSHHDEELRDELDKHLTILRRQGLIRDWHDRKIAAGTEWKGQIDDHLESADLILLLISADFIASDYCYDIELTRAMERHLSGEARVVPIVLRPVYWKGAPFGKLQALPTDARAVTMYPNRDEAFTIITEGLAEAAAQLQKVA